MSAFHARLDRLDSVPTEQVTRSEQHSFLRRFQVECPATYKPSPNMEAIKRQTVGLRSKHLFSLVADYDRSLHISSLIASGLSKFNRCCNQPLVQFVESPGDCD